MRLHCIWIHCNVLYFVITCRTLQKIWLSCWGKILMKSGHNHIVECSDLHQHDIDQKMNQLQQFRIIFNNSVRNFYCLGLQVKIKLCNTVLMVGANGYWTVPLHLASTTSCRNIRAYVMAVENASVASVLILYEFSMIQTNTDLDFIIMKVHAEN